MQKNNRSISSGLSRASLLIAGLSVVAFTAVEEAQATTRGTNAVLNVSEHVAAHRGGVPDGRVPSITRPSVDGGGGTGGGGGGGGNGGHTDNSSHTDVINHGDSSPHSDTAHSDGSAHTDTGTHTDLTGLGIHLDYGHSDSNAHSDSPHADTYPHSDSGPLHYDVNSHNDTSS